MRYSNSDLKNAFPAFLRDDALEVISVLPQPSLDTKTFSVSVGGETMSIPYRIYHDPALIDATHLTARQRELLNCLLTRHHNGFIRERHLPSILCGHDEWIPPFVVQLVGEYVVEILQAVSRNIHQLDPQLYRSFLQANPRYFALTKQRVISYWNCYYRWQRRADYAGFQIVEFLERLVTADQGPSI
jgi:hypothetical protein